MASYLIYGRREYAQPLERIGAVAMDSMPSLADLDVGDGWLELVVFPQDACLWVIRDAVLVHTDEVGR